MPLLLNSSANSITRIPFLTTIPARPTIPSPVIRPDTSIPVIANPKNTPITLNKISLKMITDLLTELNCSTSVNKMSISAIKSAFPKKATVSACCSPSPVCLMVTASVTPLKSAICFPITWLTPVAL